MRSIDAPVRRGALLSAAVLIAVAGCAREVGVADHEARYGAALAEATAMQEGRPASPEAAARLAALAAGFAAETPDTVTFAFASSALDAEARRALAAQAAWLRARPDAAVRLTGHADAVGAPGANLRLGGLRAVAAARFLEAQGVPARRIAAVESLGEADPAVAGSGRERRNRRVVTEVAWLGAAPAARRLPPLDGVRAERGYALSQEPMTIVTEASTDSSSEN